MKDATDKMPDPAIFDLYRTCRLCPRGCGADRLSGKTGFCGETAELRAGRAALHLWEEPPLTGCRGAGAVFFSGCSLRCVYCQNYDLAHSKEGVPVTADALAEVFLSLEAQGAACLDLVTPDHFVPHIIYAVKKARQSGLTLPVVWNCSGYERAETLRLLDGIVDIYLADFKYLRGDLAGKYSGAPDYPEFASAALAEMVRQQPEPVFSENGDLLRKGVLVRHLILPGQVRASMDVIRYLHETYGEKILLSIMNQYTPSARLSSDYPELARRLTKREYRRVIDYALSLGVENAFIQEGKTAEESFIPAFDGTGIPGCNPTDRGC